MIVVLVCASCSTTSKQSSSRSNANNKQQSAAVSVLVYPNTILDQPVYVAQAEGFFKENGLKVSFVEAGSGEPAALAAMKAGSIDFGSGTYNVMVDAFAKGLGFQVIADDYNKDIFSLWASKKIVSSNGPLTYPTDMKYLSGKRIGVNAVGSGSQYEAESLFHVAGVSASAETYVGVGTGVAQAEALAVGEVDAIYTYQPVPALLRYEGNAVELVNIAKNGPPALRAANGAYFDYFATNTFIRQHPSLVKAYVRSIMEAIAWLRNRTNDTKSLKIAASYIKLGNLSRKASNSVLSASLTQMQTGWGYTVSRSALVAGMNFMAQTGQISKAIPNILQLLWAGAPTVK